MGRISMTDRQHADCCYTRRKRKQWG